MRALNFAGTLLLALLAAETLLWLTTPSMVPNAHTLASIVSLVSNGALVTVLAAVVMGSGLIYAVPAGSPMPALEGIALAAVLTFVLPHLPGLPLHVTGVALILLILWTASAVFRWLPVAMLPTLGAVAGLVMLPFWLVPPVRTRLSRWLGPKFSEQVERLVFVMLIFLTLPLQPVLMLLVSVPYTRHMVDKWRQRWML